MSSNRKDNYFMKDEDGKRRPKCYVIGGGFEYIKLLYTLGCDGAKGLDDADFVLFTGGEDVNPELYGEPCMAQTRFNRQRDDKEMAIFTGALERELPMVGICRGGQFLNVANGGSMWQHVTGHTRPHVMRIETPPFNKGNKRRSITVTSTHHQMMRPTDSAIIIGTAVEALEKHGPALSKMGKKQDDPDIEVVFYDDTHCLCFQPHPEMRAASAECVDFFQECLETWIYPRIPNSTAKAILDQAKPASNKKEK